MSQPRSDRLSAGRVASHLGVMLAVAAVMGVVVAGLAIPFAGVLGIGARQVADTMDNLPAELETDPLPQKTKLLDANGDTIATLYDENRVNVSLDQISRTMVKAIVAIEDYRFYQHGALDLKGTLRALITNQANSGVVQGGSSITQQMVKMTLLTQANTKAERKAATDDTYARKLRELRYAIAFEQHYSKDWILERYLNIAYFGDGTYGIQSAARHYFNVNAKNLDLRQSAMLAGLVKNPTGYDPTNSPDAALERRNVVLDRMAELNVISRAKAERTKKMKLGLHVIPAKNGCLNSRAPFFCDYAVNWLLHDPRLGKTVEDRKKLLKSGGLVIHTTIDMRDQQAADTSVSHHVFPTDQAIGALAMVEPGTGNVKAIAQSRPMGRDEAKGETFLNYVVPKKYGDASGFQAGSTFKLFVLAAAINDGISLNTSISAPPEMSIPMNSYEDCGDQPYASTDVWPVHNSTGFGTPAFNLYTGTQLSVNTFFAQLEQRTGLCEPYKLAKEMGVDLTDPARERVPSFTLGVPSVSPLEMAEAYATVAARGLHCDARPVTSIDDSAGTQIRDYPSTCKQVMPQSTADAVNDILRGVQETGFGAQAGIALDQPSAGKTGTIDDNMAVWFCGYTPNLATASMIAGANREGHWITLNGQMLANQYIASAHGSTTAGPMWGDAMKAISAWLPDKDFVPPNADIVNGVMTVVPTTTGMSVDGARQALEDAGFYPTDGGEVNSTEPAGTVAYTSPSGGSTSTSGSSVTIYVSNGVAPAPPPSHSGGGNGGGHGNGGGNGNGGGHGNGHGRGH
jgi:membrane peptidoglycan carboxypeptidase